MSHIEGVDICRRYNYSAGVMSSHLEGLIRGELESEKSIPMSTLLVVRELFNESLALIEHDGGRESIPEHPSRATTMNLLIKNMLQMAKRKVYTSREEFEEDVRLCSELLHELPNEIRRNPEEYEILQKFFHHLHQASEEHAYDGFFSGRPSPYTHSL